MLRRGLTVSSSEEGVCPTRRRPVLSFDTALDFSVGCLKEFHTVSSMKVVQADYRDFVSPPLSLSSLLPQGRTRDYNVSLVQRLLVNTRGVVAARAQ